LATENAMETLVGLRARWEADRSQHVEALAELQKALGLKDPLIRIECYDISNLQGTAAAGSMVVFEQGVPSKSNYRKFTIKTVQGQDDFASMEEVLERRFRRWKVATDESHKPGTKLDRGFGLLPNLLIVDGGKGQLGRAIRVVEKFELEEKIMVVGLAKRNEELFLPDMPNPIILPARSKALFLVQRIRDEAHRFALRHHRTQRRRMGLVSSLDTIPGIGPVRRNALLSVFGDVNGIREADVDEVEAVPGITRALAKRVKAEL
jgi:excinuclease ABC subunit C